jgi:hypothetical protein
MRNSDIFFIFIGACLVLCAAAPIHAIVSRKAAFESMDRRAKMVRSLELTDLCLCTEARYTRHPSQADWHTPFQDYPMSLEHFPTGSIIGPPTALRGK